MVTDGNLCALVVMVERQISDFKKSGRFKETDENQAIFTVKQRAIEVIDLLFNFRFYIRLQVKSCDNIAVHV